MGRKSEEHHSDKVVLDLSNTRPSSPTTLHDPSCVGLDIDSLLDLSGNFLSIIEFEPVALVVYGLVLRFEHQI